MKIWPTKHIYFTFFLNREGNIHNFIFLSSLQKESSFQRNIGNWAELYWWEVLITMWFFATLWNFITVRKNFVKLVVYHLFFSSLLHTEKKARSFFFWLSVNKTFPENCNFLKAIFCTFLSVVFGFVFLVCFFFPVSSHSHTECSVNHFYFKNITEKKRKNLHCFYMAFTEVGVRKFPDKKDQVLVKITWKQKYTNHVLFFLLACFQNKTKSEILVLSMNCIDLGSSYS